MLYVQGGRRDITGEKGKSTEEVSPSTGKAHHHGGAVPSVSIPGVGTLSRMWARGVSVAAHVQGRALTPIPGLLSCSTSSALIPIPITASQSRREEEGQCAPLQPENKDKKPCKIGY